MVKKANMKNIIVFFGILISVSAFAQTPVKDPACAQKLKIRHPQGTGGLFFNADCSIAYVLPPSASNVSVSAIAGLSNIRQCEVLNHVLSMQEASAKKMEALMNDSSAQPPVGNGGAIDDLINRGGDRRPPPPVNDIASRLELLKQYTELTKQFQELTQLYKDVPAASAHLEFRMPWDELVNNYRATNPQTNLNFVRMPLDAAYLTFNRQISKIGSMPAVLDYDIPGISAQNSGINDTQAPPTNSQSLLVGDAYSGQIVLSLAGACPFYNASLKNVSGSISGQSISAYLNANLNYSYGLQIYRKYTVSYDLSLLVKHIKERESHGGFFSTSTSETEINSMENTDWFTLKNESNDARFNYDLLVPDLKADLMNRVIRDITMMSGFNPDDAPQVQVRTKNGAQASAEALQKCPHIYCQVGAIGLTVLDSIFGSSSAVSTYIDQRHSVAGDRVEDNKVILFHGSSVFDTASGRW